jgi:hypothetical protein
VPTGSGTRSVTLHNENEKRRRQRKQKDSCKKKVEILTNGREFRNKYYTVNSRVVQLQPCMPRMRKYSRMGNIIE